MERRLKENQLRQFEAHLLCEERSTATVEKYLHDLSKSVPQSETMIVKPVSLQFEHT